MKKETTPAAASATANGRRSMKYIITAKKNKWGVSNRNTKRAMSRSWCRGFPVVRSRLLTSRQPAERSATKCPCCHRPRKKFAEDDGVLIAVQSAANLAHLAPVIRVVMAVARRPCPSSGNQDRGWSSRPRGRRWEHIADCAGSAGKQPGKYLGITRNRFSQENSIFLGSSKAKKHSPRQHQTGSRRIDLGIGIECFSQLFDQ